MRYLMILVALVIMAGCGISKQEMSSDVTKYTKSTSHSVGDRCEANGTLQDYVKIKAVERCEDNYTNEETYDSCIKDTKDINGSFLVCITDLD